MTADEMARRPLRRDAERNRQRVLEAAKELFAVHGLEPNLNDVAHHAGVGVGTVYRRFSTKGDLLEALFEDGLKQLTALAETALAEKNSWQGFATFVERMCELTADDRGLREIAFSKVYAGSRVTAAQDRLIPVLTKVVERAQADGYLREEMSGTDMPLFGLLAGTVSGYAGNVDPQLWRRYVALLLEGMRRRRGQVRLPVGALEVEALDVVMQTWEPAGPGVHSPAT